MLQDNDDADFLVGEGEASAYGRVHLTNRDMSGSQPQHKDLTVQADVDTLQRLTANSRDRQAGVD